MFLTLHCQSPYRTKGGKEYFPLCSIHLFTYFAYILSLPHLYPVGAERSATELLPPMVVHYLKQAQRNQKSL